MLFILNASITGLVIPAISNHTQSFQELDSQWRIITRDFALGVGYFRQYNSLSNARIARINAVIAKIPAML